MCHKSLSSVLIVRSCCKKLLSALHSTCLTLECGVTCDAYSVVVVDVNNLKNCRKPVNLQKESPAGSAGEGKQSKGKEERTVKD